MIRRILVGFDGSRDAEDAVRIGAELASATGGEVWSLVVVSAIHGETDEDRAAAFEAAAVPLREKAERAMRAAGVREGAGSVHVLPGDRPVDVLSTVMHEHAFDLLVVGRHGLDRAAHGGLGRMVRELTESATYPVLLVGDGSQEH